MSRVLRKIPQYFQRFPEAPGYSVRHKRDMAKRELPQDACNLSLSINRNLQ